MFFGTFLISTPKKGGLKRPFLKKTENSKNHKFLNHVYEETRPKRKKFLSKNESVKNRFRKSDKKMMRFLIIFWHQKNFCFKYKFLEKWFSKNENFYHPKKRHFLTTFWDNFLHQKLKPVKSLKNRTFFSQDRKKFFFDSACGVVTLHKLTL